MKLGKVDPESGKMIPNSNYFEMFDFTQEIYKLSSSGYGFSYLIQKACKDMGLLECLENTFKSKSDDILAIASYIIRSGSKLEGIDGFQERNGIPWDKHLLNSNICTKLLESIRPELLNRFFKQWVGSTLKEDTVCYDIKSISSYSKVIPSVESGYSSDLEEAPQYNLGMFFSQNSKLPLYYERYHGLLTNETNMSQILKNARAVGIKNVKLILDGGVANLDCIVNSKKYFNYFTIGIPTNLDISKYMINDYKGKIYKYANKLHNQEIFCVQKATTIHGARGRLMLFFDIQNHVELCRELYGRINELSTELLDIKRYSEAKNKRYEKYFTITKHTKDSGFDFIVNSNAVDQLMDTKGFFLIFSTDKSATPEDVLYHYRNKDEDERLFDQIQLDLGSSRASVQKDRTTDGKVFVTFIAIAIRAYMLDKLQKYIYEHATSFNKVLDKIENIVVVDINGKYRFSNGITLEQREILANFHAVNDIITSLDHDMK
jgi:hypothetical protein